MQRLALLWTFLLLVGLLGRGTAQDKKAEAKVPEPVEAARLEKARAGLKSADVEVRRKTLGSLFHSDLSDSLMKEILDLLKDTDGEVRAMAATAVGNHGEAALPGVPALIAQLKGDSHKEARETAARALGRIGKAVKTSRDAVQPLRDAAAKDTDPVTRVVALGSLAMMEQDVSGQITALRKYLHHDEAIVRMKACHALGMLGTVARAAAPEIVVVLEQETDSHRRGYIARALGNTGDSDSLPALYKALKKETDKGAKGEMRGAITKLGGKVPE
jgi:HEAT repeat protein